jgi:peroxiredoxin
MYPHERSLVKAMENKPFVLLGVNSDQSKESLKKTIEDEKMTWRSWFDGPGTSGPIATKFNVHGWPTLYVVDAKGVIRHKWVGSPGEKVMDESIEKLVKEAEKQTPDSAKKDGK